MEKHIQPKRERMCTFRIINHNEKLNILPNLQLHHLKIPYIKSKNRNRMNSLKPLSPEQIVQDSINQVKSKAKTKITLTALNIEHLPEIFSKAAIDGTLDTLEELEILGVPLKSIPPEIGLCKNITSLNIQHAQLTSLPKEIANLSKLSILIVGSGNFTTLPDSLWNLQNLRTLAFIDCKITSISKNIINLKSLVDVHFLSCLIGELPTELGMLDLNACDIAPRYPSLTETSFATPQFPPPDIYRLGSSAIRRYLRAAHSGCQAVWESKLLLVGEGSVGKTSIFEALNGKLIDDKEPSEGTVGIAIGQLDLEHPTKNDIVMRLNAWDFAGQDFNHATHQFFFGNRSLFLVVWNARKGWEQCKLHSWLENIRDRAPQATVILVATHIDQPHSDYPEQKLRDEFPQIADTVKVSSRTGEGVNELKQIIKKHAAKLPMMGLRWPIAWLEAAKALHPWRKSDHKSQIEVMGLLKKHNLTEEDAEVLLRWLHELGELLYFPQIAYLRDIVTLNPEWVTRNVGIVLRCDDVQKHHGLLQQGDLERLWQPIPEHVRLYLLRLMDHFDLAYLIPDDPENRSLIVERLPQNPPEYELRWKEWEGRDQELRLRFRLKTMHPGIPTWFLARCHRFTLGLHWLSGVVFGDVTDGIPEKRNPRHLALVVADRTERTVDFIVRGPFPQKLMTLLTDGFVDTLKRYPGLEEKRLVPCPGKSRNGTACAYEFPVQTLEDRLLRTQPRQTVECNECETEHRVEKLLFGLDAGAATEPYIKEILASISKQSSDIKNHSAREAALTRACVTAESTSTREHISEVLQKCAEDFREFMELRFIQEFNEEQKLQDHSIPNVFALYPVDNASILKSEKLRLQLYCMQPGCWHSIGPVGAVQFAPAKEWVKKAAPYLLTLRKTLTITANLLKPGLGTIANLSVQANKFHNSTKESINLTVSALKELEKLKIPELLPSVGVGGATSDQEEDIYPRHIRRFKGAQLEAIRELFSTLKFSLPFGGLKRVRTPENHILWVCEEHHQLWRDPRQLEIEQRKSKAKGK